MFKEIEKELLSIISEDQIEKIAHMPTKEIAKTMDLIYHIKFEDIERVYYDNIDNSLSRMVVLYKSNKENKNIGVDLCPINGKLYHITLFPVELLNKDENNAIILCKSIIKYISARLSVIKYNYESLINHLEDNLLDLIFIQCYPVITCAIMRKIYSGPSLPKVICITLLEEIDKNNAIYNEVGINSILNIFDEGLGVDELLDNGFICSILPDDKTYPGIWGDNNDKRS